MKIGNKNIEQIIITDTANNIIAVLSDEITICNDGYKIIEDSSKN
ncbi:MAG: hypothetical protein K0S80_3913 [Neobacillus sp.]|nr:hypothetical protein [Neobacillus sp.]